MVGNFDRFSFEHQLWTTYILRGGGEIYICEVNIEHDIWFQNHSTNIGANNCTVHALLFSCLLCCFSSLGLCLLFFFCIWHFSHADKSNKQQHAHWLHRIVSSPSACVCVCVPIEEKNVLSATGLAVAITLLLLQLLLARVSLVLHISRL